MKLAIVDYWNWHYLASQVERRLFLDVKAKLFSYVVYELMDADLASVLKS